MSFQIGFIIEQVLGHITHGQNLRAFVSRDPSIEAQWGLPAWEVAGLAGKIPLYRSNWTVHAGMRTRRLLARMQRKSQLDALFFHTQVTAVLAPDWLKRIPCVVSLDATPLQIDAIGAAYEHVPGPEWLERWKWRLNRNCFRQARRIVTWSEWAKQGLVDDYEVPSGKITVIPPGVNTKDWRPDSYHDSQNERIKILFVGSDLERKGGHLLLEAFRTLRQQQMHSENGSETDIGLELHLVTKATVAAEPGLFVYNDLQPNSESLKKLYHESDIFCLPTTGDCLPMVLSEAAAAGLPTVATQLAAIPEIVIDRETGFLVPAADVGALSAALRRLIFDPDLRGQQGSAAIEYVRKRYDAQLNASRLLELIKQTVDESKSVQEHT